MKTHRSPKRPGAIPLNDLIWFSELENLRLEIHPYRFLNKWVSLTVQHQKPHCYLWLNPFPGLRKLLIFQPNWLPLVHSFIERKKWCWPSCFSLPLILFVNESECFLCLSNINIVALEIRNWESVFETNWVTRIFRFLNLIFASVQMAWQLKNRVKKHTTQIWRIALWRRML